jgi:hypothetical protein
MYDTVGFHQAYLILGCITLSFTVISLFTLKGGKTLLPARHNTRPPESLRRRPSGMQPLAGDPRFPSRFSSVKRAAHR